MYKFGSISLIIKSYVLSISAFFIFRLLLFITEIERINFGEIEISTILQAFVMGLRFDIVVSGYLLILPAFVLFVMDVIGKKSKIISQILFYFIFTVFILSFIIAAVDIPYFNHFFSRISVSVFEWFDSPEFVLSMVFEEPMYFLFGVPLFLLVVTFYKILRKIFSWNLGTYHSNLVIRLICSLLFLGVMFIGIRGRIQLKSPIRIGTAYYCEHSFLNQLGLNPVFTLLRSYLDSRKSQNKAIQLIDELSAIKIVQESLSIPGNYSSPIARLIQPDSISKNKPNLVLVIMESMSAAKMARHGNSNNLTPFLDSLSYNSLYFNNIYTTGKHTFNGVFSTLFSFPALYRQHPMKTIKSYYGMSHVLAENGYSTSYFTTHDSQFDNVEGFLRANKFENITSQKNYPISEIKTTLGVPDDYMFRHAMPILDKLNSSEKPFFTTFMTVSDHGPYYIPEYFQPKNEDIKNQIVEYADWSLNKFISMASKKSWFDNTIFVFIADHGAPISAPYDISLDYHHSPLIIYAPKLIPPSLKENIGGQIDVFPTIMGLLKQPYLNNTLGIDLLKEKRPFIFVNDDDKIGVLNDSLFLIFKDKQAVKLYKYLSKNKHNFADNFPQISNDMEQYAKANMQTFQYLLTNEKMLGKPMKKTK